MNALRVDLVFPRFKLLSGAERAILGLAGALATAGHDPRIVCHQFDDSCRPRLAPGVELLCSNITLDWSRNRYLNAVADYLHSFRLARLLDSHADVRILFGPALPLTWYLKKMNTSKVPVLYYCWEPPRVLYQDRDAVLSRLGGTRFLLAPLLRAYALLDRYLVTLVDAVCTSSPFAAERIQAIYQQPATVITLGVDRHRLDSARLEVPKKPPTVLTVNYLHPRKRVDLIVAAAAVMMRTWPDHEQPRWIVVGDGPERTRLQRLAEELGVRESIEFTGFVPDDELPMFYAGATCYVHAGLEESFGLSVVEAAYCGCPVVAVDEGGVRETVKHQLTGFLVPPVPRDLAEAIKAVVSREDLGRSLGAAGHKHINQNYRWSQGAVDVIQLAETVRA
jgi:glycosyltransferase involved in cell wall biosynthesis